jgi:Tn3 transposase DDE domain
MVDPRRARPLRVLRRSITRQGNDDALATANARLASEQSGVELAQRWGGGDVASADGIRFVVLLRMVHAGPNPKYFGFSKEKRAGFRRPLWSTQVVAKRSELRTLPANELQLERNTTMRSAWNRSFRPEISVLEGRQLLSAMAGPIAKPELPVGPPHTHHIIPIPGRPIEQSGTGQGAVQTGQ